MKLALLSLLLAAGCSGSTNSVHFARAPLGEGGSRLPTPEAAFRAAAPQTGAIVPFAPPMVVETFLSNGIRVLSVERHDFPIVSLRLVSSHGSDRAPLGVAAIWSRLVFRGPDGDDRDKFGRAFAAHGANHWARYGDESVTLQVEVLSGDYLRTVEILGEAIRASTFPTSALEDARDLQISTIARRDDSAHALASLAMYESLYPVGDPYHDNPGGTAATIKAVTRDQLVAFHRDAMDAARLSIAVAGDFDPKAMHAELEKDFGKLPNLQVPPPPKPAAVEKSSAPRVVLIDRPGATQATVIVAAIGVAFDHADRAALDVLRARLSAKVYFNLREEHAFTYGAASHATFFRRPGPVFVEGAIDKDHTGEAITQILAEIEKLRGGAIVSDEVSTGRDDSVVDVALHFDTINDVAAALSYVGVLGLPASHYIDLVKRLQSVTPADLTRVANTYFANDAIHIIVVGDSKALKAQLDALGDGKVEIEKGPPENAKVDGEKTPD